MTNTDRYGFDIGHPVHHIKDDSVKGVVTEIDSDHDLGDVTTCRVAWGCETLEEAMKLPRDEHDIQWTNKLEKVQ